MKKANSITVMLLLSLLPLGPNDQTVAKNSSSAPRGVKTGLWEIEQSIEIPNAPGGGMKQKWQQCITQEDAKKGPLFSNVHQAKSYLEEATEGTCKIENIQYPARGRITYEVVCREDKKVTRIKAEYQYNTTTFEGTMQMAFEKDEEAFATYKMKGKYIGSCKK